MRWTRKFEQVTDHSSRYLIAIECVATGEEDSLPLQLMDKAMS